MPARAHEAPPPANPPAPSPRSAGARLQMMAVNRLDKYDKGRTATVTKAGCLSNCSPRPEVTAKCKTHATAKSQVQGKMMFACVD